MEKHLEEPVNIIAPYQVAFGRAIIASCVESAVSGSYRDGRPDPPPEFVQLFLLHVSGETVYGRGALCPLLECLRLWRPTWCGWSGQAMIDMGAVLQK